MSNNRTRSVLRQSCCNNSTRSARCCPRPTVNCGWYARTYSNPPIMPPATTEVEGISSMYLTATAVSVDAGFNIPLENTIQSGNRITFYEGGAYLQQGLYEVSFSLTATSSTTETQSVEIIVDGDFVPQLKSSISAIAGQIYTLSSSGLVKIGSGGGYMYLTNVGSSSQDYADVSLTIFRIG